MTKPKKIPSELKKIAERRARATAAIERVKNSIPRVDLLIQEARVELAKLEVIRTALEAKLRRCQGEVESADETLRNKFPSVTPALIDSTYGFREEYKHRGILIQTVQEILMEANGAPLTTKEIALSVVTQLGISLASPAELKTWIENSLWSALRKLEQTRLELTKASRPGNPTTWTWTPKSLDWDALVELQHETDSG